MKVILTENIQALGSIGELVDVKAGFARNHLLPKSLALVANKNNIAVYEARKADLQARAAERLATAEAIKAKVDGKSITYATQVGGEGKLFGSVGAADVAVAIAEQLQTEVDKSQVRFADGPVRVAGEHTVGLHLYAGVDASLTLNIPLT